MLPTNPGGHAAYQDTFLSDFLKFCPNPFALSKSTWDYIVQFWYFDLSQTDSVMRDCYSIFGPQPKLPSYMLRSYLLALKLKVTSITVWYRMFKETPLYAILSVFPFGDTPGVGTFYDFFSHLWKDGPDNLSPKDRFPKMKPPKGKKKGQKTPYDSSRLLPLLERWHLKPQNPFSLIFRLYRQQFFDLSIRKGLISPDHLALAGNGTPAQQRKKQICDCKEHGCTFYNYKRHYSQPDCNWGWDSHKEFYFFGYHLYMYVASASYSDLPIFPLLEQVSRHDMLSFLHSFFTMKAYLPEFCIGKLLLDSAHDAYAVYEYCGRKDITPFIGLTPGHTRYFTYKNDFTIGDDGVPVCKMGLSMHKDGYEAAKHRAKYRCPKSGRKCGCFCKHLCSPAKYGRTVHILQLIIQGCLTYRQETAKHGKRNLTEGLMWNASINARKRTIN